MSRRHSQILKTEEEFYLHILSVLSEIRDSSLIPSPHNCFWLWEFFSPIRSNSRVFSVCYPESINSGLFVLSYHSSILPVHHSSILYSARDLFVLVYQIPLSIFTRSLILTVIRSLFFIHFKFSRWLVQAFSSYCINSFVLFKSYRWFVEDFLTFTLYLSLILAWE